MRTTAGKLLMMFSDPSYFMLASSLAGLKIAFGQYVFNDWNFVGFLIPLLVFDTVLGVYKAWKKGELSSSGYGRVLEKVLLYTGILIVAHVLQNFSATSFVSAIFSYFADFLKIGVMVREGISILENTAEIKPDMLPKWVLKRLKKFDEGGKLKDLINADEDAV